MIQNSSFHRARTNTSRATQGVKLSENATVICYFKDHIMRLNAYIESLTSIFFGQIFDMKKSLQENINQLEIAITSNLRRTELNTPDQKTR